MNVTANRNFDLLQNLLFPELLEDSKILSILTDDFKFKIEDFINIKEVQKISNDKGEIINLLKQMQFITLNENSDSCSITLFEEFTLISLLNIPSTVQKKSELLSMLNVQDCDRLYKKNFFIWYLVVSQVSLKERILNNLKCVQFNEEKLKFEVYSIQVIKKNILKRLQTLNYHKETSGLKSNYSLSSNNNSETGSWRKKSTDSEELSLRKGSNKNSSNNNQDNSSSLFKRKRFNSDGGEDVSKFNQNEAILPLKTFLNEAIKYRYNLKKLFDVFEDNGEYFNRSPKFVTFIEDICTREKRVNLNILSPIEISQTTKRDRSKTFHISDNQFKLNLRETDKFVLPKNNPLQDFGNH